MKKLALITLSLSLFISLSASANADHEKAFRLDCRFNGTIEHEEVHCRSHAQYEAPRHHQEENTNDTLGCGDHCREVQLKDIKYTVICNNDVKYANAAVGFSTNDPTILGEDHVRPVTANVPETRILVEGALLKEGTYGKSYLDLDKGQISGTCDVTEVECRH